MKKTIAILAHVDAGKTTFSEQTLYYARAIRSVGRVDHQDAFLDAHPIERQRGITVFSGLANFEMQDDTWYWLDTPGHVDFSTEMERALSVADYAILVISCAEGVQSHTETVWQLLGSYGVPVFVFLNKTDREGADPERVMNEIRKRLSPEVLDLRTWQESGVMDGELQEAIAALDENLLDRLFSDGFDETVWAETLTRLIRERKCFPVMAGAALEGRGMEGALGLISRLSRTDYHQKTKDDFVARVYQVRHDAQGMRLCFMKVLSGSIRVKDELPVGGEMQKINELRVYHGEKYRPVDRAEAGDIVAMPGMEGLRPGDWIGREGREAFRTDPMMEAELLYDQKQVPAFRMMQALRYLEDEEPSLAVSEREGRISVHVMGKIQLEIWKQLLKERFGYDAEFGSCRVLYKETLAEPTLGIGHYEPLRHYAEAHLMLYPGQRGSGVSFRSKVHVDDLTLNWQRLIRSHVLERTHKGVLIGAPLTDVVVELVAGKDHLKHTEGGDFRQAVYRAIRNGLMYGKSVVLEPVCGFVLRAPADNYGAIAGALSRMKADVEPPEYEQDSVILRGEAAYSLFSPWQEEFLRQTHGRGSLRLWMSRYDRCHNEAEVIEAAGYNPLADETPDSVFCAKGAGFTVPWDEVRNYAHLPVKVW